MRKNYDKYMWEKELGCVADGCSDDFIEGMVVAYKHTIEWMRQNGINIDETKFTYEKGFGDGYRKAHENILRQSTEPRRIRIQKIAAALRYLQNVQIYGKPTKEDNLMVAKLLVFAEDDFSKFLQHGRHEWTKHVVARNCRNI